ncbi:hypothetical protein TNCV_1182321 [Trichonephila clavipes]|nr:hypothetical protein TNCV_1182321 [Trichonephila clavipes]
MEKEKKRDEREREETEKAKKRDEREREETEKEKKRDEREETGKEKKKSREREERALDGEKGPRNSSWQGARCVPVFNRSFEHRTDDSSICPVFTPMLRENTWVFRGISPSFPFHQPNEKIRGSMAI